MNVLAILESDIIKNVIEDILTDEMAIEEIKVVKPTFDLNKIDYEDIGMIIIDLRNDYEKIVSYIEKIKRNYSQIKIVVIDVRKRLDLFKRLIKSSIEGYIVDILDRDEFAYIMHKIIIGKKFYDLDLFEESLKENRNGKDRLTIRENEIFSSIVKKMWKLDFAIESIVEVTGLKLKKVADIIINSEKLNEVEIEKGKIGDIIKNLLKMNISIDVISEASGLSIEEIGKFIDNSGVNIIIRNLLNMNVPIEIIIKVTGLSIESIDALNR